MKWVPDSSIALKWVLLEALSDKAKSVRDDFENGTHELIAPDIFLIEVAHALTRAERQGRITPPQGEVHLADVMSSCPRLHPYLPLLPRAFAISSSTRQGVYDCLYLALAEREGCELLTADTRLITNLQAAFPLIKSLASLP